MDALDDPLAAAIAASMPRTRYSVRSGPGCESVHFAALETTLRPCVETPADHLVLDLETLGFQGHPLFLIGLLLPEREAPEEELPEEGLPEEELPERSGQVRLLQLLARDYGEEEAVLEAFVAASANHPVWVTFNGKAFDLPFLRRRAAFYRRTFREPRTHIDLLHPARRIWRGLLPDCRLKTLEARVFGRWRGPDPAGGEIPRLYHDFVATGDPSGLVQVLRHNLEDLVTLLRLYAFLDLGVGEGVEGGEAMEGARG
jgi:hypothetical protein